jgi:hypothetical protein
MQMSAGASDQADQLRILTTVGNIQLRRIPEPPNVTRMMGS